MMFALFFNLICDKILIVNAIMPVLTMINSKVFEKGFDASFIVGL